MDDALQPTVGLLLRQRRQELEFSLADLATKTRIRKAYLEALERDAFEDLPGDAYRSGFLRSYADALGLESDHILRQWREQESSADQGRADHSTAPGSTDRALPGSRRRIILPILSLLLVTMIALYLSIGRRGELERHDPVVSTERMPQPATDKVSAKLEGERARPEVMAPLSAGGEDSHSIQRPPDASLASLVLPNAEDRVPPEPSASESEEREAKR